MSISSGEVHSTPWPPCATTYPNSEGLVEKPPRSRRYRLPAEGYSTCLIFLKLFQRLYVPSPLAFSARPQRVTTEDLDELLRAFGLTPSSAATRTKFLLSPP